MKGEVALLARSCETRALKNIFTHCILEQVHREEMERFDKCTGWPILLKSQQAGRENDSLAD